MKQRPESCSGNRLLQLGHKCLSDFWCPSQARPVLGWAVESLSTDLIPFRQYTKKQSLDLVGDVPVIAGLAFENVVLDMGQCSQSVFSARQYRFISPSSFAEPACKDDWVQCVNDFHRGACHLSGSAVASSIVILDMLFSLVSPVAFGTEESFEGGMKLLKVTDHVCVLFASFPAADTRVSCCITRSCLGCGFRLRLTSGADLGMSSRSMLWSKQALNSPRTADGGRLKGSKAARTLPCPISLFRQLRRPDSR